MTKTTWWRPSWARPFIVEQEDIDINELNPLKLKAPWTAIVISMLLVAGLALHIAAFVHHQTKLGIAVIVLFGFSLLWTTIFRPRTASVVLCLTTTAVLVVQVFTLLSHWDDDNGTLLRHLGSLGVSLSGALLILLLNMPIRSPSSPRSDISAPYSESTSKLRSPEDNLTPWMWMSASWVAPLLDVGRKRQLEDSDVWKLPYEFQHANLFAAFRELKGSVIGRVFRANWIDVAILWSLACVELATTYSNPFVLQKLLVAMKHLDVDKLSALKWATLILIIELVNAQSGVFSLWYGRRTYERTRGELITMVYEKTLNRKIVSSIKGIPDEKEEDEVLEENQIDPLASGANDRNADDEVLEGEETETTALLGKKATGNKRKGLLASVLQPVITLFNFRRNKKLSKQKNNKAEDKSPAQTGKILSLIKSDAYEIAQRFWEVQTFVKKPFGLVLCVVLVWQIIGPAYLLGVAVLAVSQTLGIFIARILRDREKIRRAKTDTRQTATSQYIEAIRYLRYYEYHHTWLERVKSDRLTELRQKVINNCWGMLLWITNALGSDLMLFASFLAYTAIMHKQLRVEIAFPALELLYLLQNELRGLPDLFVALLSAQVALGRLESFMAEPDKEEDDITQHGNDVASEAIPVEGSLLAMTGATLAWPGLTKPVLTNASVSFSTGLHVISGPVASGKSMILKALLGEVDVLEGGITRHNGAVGYCSQQPWLQSMTIKENIIFTSQYDERRYEKTIAACALTQDFANFKDGDASAIGENGIGLSGGQKARTALARAVYSRAEVLLLDDVFSALDQETGQYIVDKLFKSELITGRTVVLVTHRLDLVRGIATQRILVKDGQIHVNEEEDEAAHSSDESTNVGDSDDDDAKVDGKTVTAVEEEGKPAKKWEEEEKRQRGSVKLDVYWEYIRAGGLVWWSLVLLTAISCRVFVLAETWFVKEWGEKYGEEQPRLISQMFSADFQLLSSRSIFDRIFDGFPLPDVNVYPWLVGLLVILIMQSVSVTGTRAAMLLITFSASKSLFSEIMEKVSGTTFHFYDVTPVGRLMNRLTSDVGTIDGAIAGSLFALTWNILSWVSAVFIIASITPLFLLIAILLSLVFVFIFFRFLPSSQSLRRLETASLSPLMSNFGALLEGLITVRAFRAQKSFRDKCIDAVDTFQKMDHFYWQVQAWLMYRFDIMSATSTFILTVTAIYSGISPGLTAFVLVAASKFVNATHSLCRMYGQIQLDFVSVERIVELLRLPQESKGDIDPPASWPTYGSDIIFENVTMKYAPHLDPALIDITCTIPGGTTTAIIGRTGSGKSTLALSLLATLEPTEGRILIDGIDISRVNKQALRSRITFLAQEPVLFPGTLRHNLDPIEEYSDAACEGVLLRISGTSNATSALVGGRPWTLSTEIETGGKNLSHGQRQLIGLARAILRRSAIIIMDEATASVDQETAWEVQKLLRDELKESTVVSIAHRAEAVHGVENCLVLGKGRLIRQGNPADFAAGSGGGSGSGGNSGIATPDVREGDA